MLQYFLPVPVCYKGGSFAGLAGVEQGLLYAEAGGRGRKSTNPARSGRCLASGVLVGSSVIGLELSRVKTCAERSFGGIEGDGVSSGVV